MIYTKYRFPMKLDSRIKEVSEAQIIRLVAKEFGTTLNNASIIYKQMFGVFNKLFLMQRPFRISDKVKIGIEHHTISVRFLSDSTKCMEVIEPHNEFCVEFSDPTLAEKYNPKPMYGLFRTSKLLTREEIEADRDFYLNVSTKNRKKNDNLYKFDTVKILRKQVVKKNV